MIKVLSHEHSLVSSTHFTRVNTTDPALSLSPLSQRRSCKSVRQILDPALPTCAGNDSSHLPSRIQTTGSTGAAGTQRYSVVCP